MEESAMPQYVWSNDLETGNPMIDSQHKELIRALNNLLDACSAGRGRELLNETLDFLTDYTAKHFSAEEKLQMQHKYPQYESHKKLHDGFKQVVAELAGKLKAKGPDGVLVIQVNSNIGGWLLNHIKKEDMKVAAHIRGRN
jgi:hemerythrin